MSLLGLTWEDPFRAINARLDTITELLEQIMTEQADIDSATTAVLGLLTDLTTQTASILADVQAFQANPTADTSKLDTAVAGIQQVQTALDSAVSTLSSAAPAGGTVTPPPPPAPAAS